MSADLGAPRRYESREADPYSVTVLAPLGDPEVRSDLERPEAAVLEIFSEVARLARVEGRAPAQVLPVRRREQTVPYGARRRSVEMLDATTLEDVAEALGDNACRVVHAVGWEAGVVASAVSQSNITVEGGSRSVVVLEPLGAPGTPEWSLADHASALIVQSAQHRLESLRHGVPAGLLHVVPPAAPRCPIDLQTDGSAERAPVLAVVGDGLSPMVLDVVERILRASADVHLVFAGTAGRDSRLRRHATTMRSWPAAMSARLHAAATVTWPLLAKVDGVIDVATPHAAPRAPLAAMAASRPVLAIGDSPAGEVVSHGETGVCLPGVDPARLAAGLGGVLADQALMRRLGRAGRMRYLREHAPDARARRLANVYDSAVD